MYMLVYFQCPKVAGLVAEQLENQAVTHVTDAELGFEDDGRSSESDSGPQDHLMGEPGPREQLLLNLGSFIHV